MLIWVRRIWIKQVWRLLIKEENTVIVKQTIAKKNISFKDNFNDAEQEKELSGLAPSKFEMGKE